MEVHPQSCAVRSDVHEGVPRTTPRDSTHTRPFLYVAGLSRDRFLAHTLLGTIDFLARSRSSTHAGARPGARRSVGRAGVWACGQVRRLVVARLPQRQPDNAVCAPGQGSADDCVDVLAVTLRGLVIPHVQDQHITERSATRRASSSAPRTTSACMANGWMPGARRRGDSYAPTIATSPLGNRMCPPLAMRREYRRPRFGPEAEGPIRTVVGGDRSGRPRADRAPGGCR